MDRAKVFDKLQKLDALARRAGTPEEAAHVRRQFARLCLQYDFQEDTFDTEQVVESEPESASDVLFSAKRASTWRGVLAQGIAQASGVFLFLSRNQDKSELRVVGRRSDIQVTAYLFQALAADVERLTPLHCAGLGRTYANNFRHGMVAVLCEKVQEAYGEAKESAEAAGDSKALIRLNDAPMRTSRIEAALRRRGCSFEARTARSRGDSGARAHGRRIGERVTVRPSEKKLSSGSGRLTS